MEPKSWECPTCRRPTTVTDADHRQGQATFNTPNTSGEGWAIGVVVELEYVLCPNPTCRQPTLEVAVRQSYNPNQPAGPVLLSRRLLPASAARVFPSYVPDPVKEDYEEACAIVQLSPKASATLSRRCLQGMIRDFHKIAKDTLKQEIDALEHVVDGPTWKAIDAVRQIGNVGAHMEKDIGMIVDVQPVEAELLIQLIETLVDEWYIARHERDERNNALVAAAAAKQRSQP